MQAATASSGAGRWRGAARGAHRPSGGRTLFLDLAGRRGNPSVGSGRDARLGRRRVRPPGRSAHRSVRDRPPGVRPSRMRAGRLQAPTRGGSAMRAIVMSRHGGPDVLEVTEQPVPEPGPGDLLVDVAAAGGNYRDVYERDGSGGDGGGRP